MNRMIKKLCLIILISLFLAGCASTGVVPMNKDTYLIGKRSAQFGLGPPVGAQADVYREANEFCSKQNMKVETVNFELTDSMPFRPGSVALEFRCIN
jgi:hypothetical protein